ncbi:hypothetical protein GCK72_013045 [Caenorhabditis remanei]|uniref:BED-type domain-containing protein n=1 Tax=Caenorhabditis remanei TaxID=31234 RepID=A0A6A5GQD6_CAERE|nr:hypothetical protein GCK72_013045 [Caenorhabditis remanei]KAF1756592.1 hypothetical protein GCK72_013045 [Caenorhabditis remanei]
MSLRRKTHSKYDDYFERTKECAKCLKCNKVIKLSPHSGSNNLKYHLEKEHMDLFNEIRENDVLVKKKREMSIAESRTQSTIPFLPVSRVSVKMAPSKSGGDVLNNWSQWQKNGSRSAEVEVSLMEMIAHDVLPLRTIEKPGFLNFLKILAPKLRRAIALLQIDNPKLNLPIIDSREWDVIDLLCEVLKPLAETTKAVQSRFEATASVVIPSLKLLEFKLNRMKREESIDERRECIAKLNSTLALRTQHLHSDSFLRTCTFLDPRFKDSFFSFSHKDYIIQKSKTATNTTSENTDGCSDVVVCTEESPLTLYQSFLKENSPEPTDPIEKDSIAKEIDEYLQHPPSQETDPYAYWNNAENLPHLKKMALEFLCVPATSSESERLFSLSGLICSPRRTNLTPERLDQLTFCSQNIKIFGFSS